MKNIYVEAGSLFQALADPTRLELLQRVEAGECCASDLNAALGMSQPRIARHMKILVDAGLVTFRRDGRFVRYLLTMEPGVRGVVGAALALLGPISEQGGKAADSRVRQAQTVLPGFVRSVETMKSAARTEKSPDSDEDPPRDVLEDFLL